MTTTELIGVYHADGGVVGELSYVIGSVLGRAHCSLCDFTHGAVRRCKEWDVMVARRGVPFLLLHRNEMPPDVASLAATTGTPVVLARATGGDLRPLLSPEELEGIGGTIEAFDRALDAALAT